MSSVASSNESRSGASTPTSGSSVNGGSPFNSGSASVSSSRRGSIRDVDTKERLFGGPNQEVRRVRDHMKSNIFSETDSGAAVTRAGSVPSSPAKKKIQPVRRNPITGEILSESVNYPVNKVAPNQTNGTANGLANGLAKLEINNSIIGKVNGETVPDSKLSSNGTSGSANGSSLNGSLNGSMSSLTSTPIRNSTRQPPGGKSSISFS